MNDPDASRPSVLLVTDSADLPRTLRGDGCSLVTETSAEAGLRRLAADEIDAVVSEHALPGIDGLGFLRAVRAEHPELPFVLRADGSETLAGAAIAAGVTEYVPQSAGEEVFRRRVNAALAGTASGASAAIGATVERLASAARVGTDGETDLESRAGIGATHTAANGPIAAALRLKERAMDEAPVGITISDATAPDYPLIYVNDAFERITGYAREEALGRNCRFLQGERSAPEAVAEMREAVREATPTSVEIVNYRRDGTPFWNEVDIAPISDPDGTVTHFVGFQTDVTDRKNAEREVERKAGALARERASLERLLDRIEGLVHETTGALVTAGSREAAERAVTERIAAATPYAFAWIGEPAPTGESVTPRAWASADGNDFADVLFDAGAPIDLEARVPDGSALAAAIAERSPHVDPDPPLVATARARGGSEQRSADADRSADVDAAGHDALDTLGTVGALPIAYRDSLYGVLCVYTEAGSDIDERELVVLDALCNALATAIDAFESKRVLTAEDVLELEFEITDRELFFAAISARAECALDHAGSIHAPDGSLCMFVTITGASPERVSAIAADCSEIADASLVTEHEDACLFEIRVTDPPLVSVLADHGARTREITANEGVCRLCVDLPHERDARSVATALEDRYGTADLVSYHERERPARTAGEFFDSVENRLTDRQLTALRTAYLSGFFEWPRPVSGDDLSDSMDISRSTFHQHLRAAERKVFDVFFDR